MKIRGIILGMMIIAGWVTGTVALAASRTVDFGGHVWQETRGKHFLVYFQPPVSAAEAERTLDRAEYFYQTIGDFVGYKRYNDFWTWDERAKIFIFGTQEAFVAVTGAPAWATGYSDRDSYLFESRAIVTFYQDRDFYETVLPHEIAHLVMRDFLGRRLAVWLEEGVAQMYERGKHARALALMRRLVPMGRYIPFATLDTLDIRQERDSRKVEVFYLQSVSIVGFLYEAYGAAALQDFFRAIRGGQTVEAALRAGSGGRVRNLAELEAAWLNFIK